jgi:predicted signal transduction protein with EAL and GGDEF domain
VVGDQVLVGIGARLTGVLREGDTVARVGGDEFVVVLPDVGKDRDAAVVARKILESLAAPLRVEGLELRVTPSIGVAVAPGDGNEPEVILRHADAAMYEAKAAGRNNFHFYAEAAHHAANRSFSLESELRLAVEAGDICLHFQPQVDLGNSRVVGCEALVRWHHPREGLLGADRIIPLAQEGGLMVALGHRVIEAACRAAAAWQCADLPPRRVAVNLSGRECAASDLPWAVERALADSGLPASCLELEIDGESLDLSVEVEENLTRLKALGVRLTAERFGASARELLALRRLRVDRLKIDLRAFRDAPADADEGAVVAGLLQLAGALGLEASAAGVETQSQLDFLRRTGCREAQGEAISHPLDTDQLLSLLNSAVRVELGD